MSMDIQKTKSNFYKKVVVAGILERDFLLDNLRDYRFENKMSKHLVSAVGKNRLDLISLQYYQTTIYWYMIAEVNGIEDAMDELEIGDVLKIPALADINRIVANVK